ncbi:transcription elongation factor A N-terminal and central domain-containing protein isoform X1 [Python bivittatus]|uniref:Transcription elongation factor A N-terminal and central domain-containing protein isoform X1 n=2 Tax=Python bivittatus TaxID=176946 RepID=A0A9F2NQQ4_PYTBI|nr:transcription elongation factor A N-terminal and central domain-containing protein isoform X1 [Python bivittatus]
MKIAPEFEMSNRSIIMTTAGCIENLLHKKNYQDIGSHLEYLETVDMTITNLQETDIAKAVFQILKNCPSVVLKNKAKHLLSKWKKLYKKYQSMQIKPGPSNMEESFENDQVVLENINLCEKQGQHEKVDPVSFNHCLPSESSSKAIRSNAQEDDAIQPEHLGVSCLVSKTNASEDPITALRCKCIELLCEALLDSSTSNEQNEKHHKIAEEIEQHIFAMYVKNNRKYKNCIRSKVLNLKNPKNSHLKSNLLTGALNPKTFADMSVMEMAHAELKQLRTSYTKSSVLEHQLPQNINGTHTSKIKCRHCEKYDCTVTVIARGALFLPGWVRNTNADEQMMTYVICNECGEQWYHSRWICL